MVDDDPIEFKPVIVNEEDDDDQQQQLRVKKNEVLNGPVLTGGYSRTGGVV